MHHKSIYISSLEPRAGSLIIATGLMEMLKGQYEKVAFFRPIISNEKGIENDIDFMLKHFELNMDYDECYGFTVNEYIEAYGNDDDDKLHENLIHKVKNLHKKYDFVLIEGYPRSTFTSIFDFDINLAIAKNLNTAFIPILNAKGKSSSKIVNELQMLGESVRAEGCKHLATIVNRYNENIKENIELRLATKDIDEQIYLLPEVKELNTPTLREVTDELNATMLLGDESQLQHLVYGHKIAAMGVENYITHISNGDIVIVPGDRVDIILVSILSFYAKEHSNIVAIILSGGIQPNKPIMDLLKAFKDVVIPIFLVQEYSYETALKLDETSANITPESTRKITLAKGLFDTNIDKEKISKRFKASSSNTLTPIMFEYKLFEQAQSNKQRIILPESFDDRVLRAAEILLNREVADIILLGNPKKVKERCLKLNINISKATIVNSEDIEMREKFSQTFYQMRKAKGLTIEMARDSLAHVNYFATMMMYEGMADGMVSGAAHTTSDTIRPALQIIKTKKDTSIVSSIFFMCLDTKVLVYGDCAVNLDPSAKELAQIAVSSADTAKEFGIEPKVALLSYSTGTSGSGPDVEKVREATKIAQELRADYLIEGPMQYDAAIDKSVAKKKLPQSKVAGEASVFIFPDLNTGNNTYKAVQRSTNALAIGPIMQGLRLPINDLSRGCLVDDIVNTVAITAIQAQRREKDD